MTNESKARAYLAAAIARSGLTKTELARRSGISRSFINRYLSGKRDATIGTYTTLAACVRAYTRGEQR